MEDIDMKIGQEITIREDFEINNIVSNTIINIKEGDKGLLDSKGFLPTYRLILTMRIQQLKKN